MILQDEVMASILSITNIAANSLVMFAHLPCHRSYRYHQAS